MMRKMVVVRMLLMAMLVGGVLAACSPSTPGAGPTPTAAVSADVAAIQEAMTGYMAGGGGAVPFQVRVEEIAGDYARVTLVPNDPQAMEGGIVFLQREDARWHVLIAGTAFMPGELDALSIPETLRGGN
jgi:hypothetical protein